VAIHELPPEQSIVETEFIRRRDAYLSSAISAFIRSLQSEGYPKLQAAE